ncbi:hypothetical protein GQ53DRAFT_748240 [Thozetella sp. PMI_491]|nr:hypothetical protein GQ53DRAFT_748240 [Thozetella sp. PMI_491]
MAGRAGTPLMSTAWSWAAWAFLNFQRPVDCPIFLSPLPAPSPAAQSTLVLAAGCCLQAASCALAARHTQFDFRTHGTVAGILGLQGWLNLRSPPRLPFTSYP